MLKNAHMSDSLIYSKYEDWFNIQWLYHTLNKLLTTLRWTVKTVTGIGNLNFK